MAVLAGRCCLNRARAEVVVKGREVLERDKFFENRIVVLLQEGYGQAGIDFSGCIYQPLENILLNPRFIYCYNQTIFRGISAPASLKYRGSRCRSKISIRFRGIPAPAPLKLVVQEFALDLETAISGAFLPRPR